MRTKKIASNFSNSKKKLCNGILNQNSIQLKQCIFLILIEERKQMIVVMILKSNVNLTDDVPTGWHENAFDSQCKIEWPFDLCVCFAALFSFSFIEKHK